jgi:hypothetical protein
MVRLMIVGDGGRCGAGWVNSVWVVGWWVEVNDVWAGLVIALWA